MATETTRETSNRWVTKQCLHLKSVTFGPRACISPIKYLLYFKWPIRLLLLLILVAGLLSPGLPRLWRFVLTRATVATHPLPSLPLAFSAAALRLAECLVKRLKATGRAHLYYGVIPSVTPMVPTPTPICEASLHLRSFYSTERRFGILSAY